MRTLIVGTGGVGAAAAAIARRRQLDAVPLLKLLAEYGTPHGISERDPAHPQRALGG